MKAERLGGQRRKKQANVNSVALCVSIRHFEKSNREKLQEAEIAQVPARHPSQRALAHRTHDKQIGGGADGEQDGGENNRHVKKTAAEFDNEAGEYRANDA